MKTLTMIILSNSVEVETSGSLSIHSFFSAAQIFCIFQAYKQVDIPTTSNNINQSLVIRICNACQRVKRKLTFISYLPYCFLLFLRLITNACAHI